MLNWIVPCRRAAVTQEVTCRQALDLWLVQLGNYRETLKEWYSIAEDESFNEGLDDVRTGEYTPPLDCEHDDDATCCPEEPLPFWPRLWKGPLRVVWEEKANADGDLSDDPPAQVCSRGMVYGQSLPLGRIWADPNWNIMTYWSPSRDQARSAAMASGRRAISRRGEGESGAIPAQSANYPKTASNGLRGGMPLTPGWACVSLPVFFSHYMLDTRNNGGTRATTYLCTNSFPGHANISCLINAPRGDRYACQVETNAAGSGPILRFRRREADAQVLETEDDVVVLGYDLWNQGGHNVIELLIRSPAARIEEENQMLDGKGYLCAYDPITGEDIGGGATGRYLHLNAGGGIVPQSPESVTVDGTPFTIRLTEINAIFTSLEPKDQPGYHPHEPSRQRHDHPYNINLAARFNLQDIGASMQGTPYPPIAINHMGDRVDAFYADRAVPFPTMRECDDNSRFPDFPGETRIDLSAPRSGNSVELDHQKRAADNDIVFYPGDVVEFPLALFLAACGKCNYAGIKFDPNGSFLRGNSVYAPHPSSPSLHDNIIAMRFQLFLDLAQGAFYCDEFVGRREGSGARRYQSEQEPEAQDEQEAGGAPEVEDDQEAEENPGTEEQQETDGEEQTEEETEEQREEEEAPAPPAA